MRKKFCPYCGTLLTNTTRSCSNCHKPQPLALPRRYWLRAIPIITIAATLLLAFAVYTYRNHLLNSFQPAKCTILSSKITVTQQHTEDDEGPQISYTYTPSFEYTISIPGQTPIKGSGYSIPAESSFDNAAEAKAIQDRYQPTDTYPCWYSPIALRPSGLILQSDAPIHTFLTASSPSSSSPSRSSSFTNAYTNHTASANTANTPTAAP